MFIASDFSELGRFGAAMNAGAWGAAITGLVVGSLIAWRTRWYWGVLAGVLMVPVSFVAAVALFGALTQ